MVMPSPAEWFRNVLQIIRLHTDAVVFHHKAIASHSLVLFFEFSYRKGDSTSIVCVLGSIVQKVYQHLLQPLVVAQHLIVQALRGRKREGLMLPLHRKAYEFSCLLDQVVHAEVLIGQLNGTTFNFADVQHFIDQA